MRTVEILNPWKFNAHLRNAAHYAKGVCYEPIKRTRSGREEARLFRTDVRNPQCQGYLTVPVRSIQHAAECANRLNRDLVNGG